MKNTCFILVILTMLAASSTAQVFTATNKYNNIVRIGIDNHLIIKVPGVNFMDVITTTDNGSFGRQYSDSDFIYNPVKAGDAIIHIAVKTRNGTKKIGDAIFHVKEMPPYVATLCGKKEGNISKAVLINCPGPRMPKIEEMNIYSAIIGSFTIKLVRNNVAFYERALKMQPGSYGGANFDKATIMNFTTLKIGDVVWMTQIRIYRPDSKARALDDIRFTVVE